MQDKERERRVSQTKEKSVTHREQGGQGKKSSEKPNSAQKRGEGKKKKCLQPRSGRSGERERQQGRTERKKEKRYGEREIKSRGGGGGECQG